MQKEGRFIYESGLQILESFCCDKMVLQNWMQFWDGLKNRIATDRSVQLLVGVLLGCFGSCCPKCESCERLCVLSTRLVHCVRNDTSGRVSAGHSEKVGCGEFFASG